jgi:hypothetical protein
MKSILQKIKSFPILAGIFVFLLQSYMLMYGCSNTASNSVTADGYSLYASKCGSCHHLLPPQDHTMDQWRHYVDKYGKKTTQLEKQTVLDYLEQRAADAQDSQQELSH